MQSTNRIIVNSLILYAKIIICMVISLWTVPLVLKALGEDDFGLYNLVAGVVVMLSFMNGAMTISTQRYLSVTIGERNKEKLQEVYNISILLHIIIGLIVVILVEALMPFLFEYVLKMDAGRVDVGHYLFHYLVISMFLSIATVPFDAVLNAYENMLVFSIVGIIEALLKLAIALCLPYLLLDKLHFYGVAIMVVAALVFAMKAAYVMVQYRQLHLSFASCRNKKLFWEMFCFAGWNTISSLSIMVRNQGLAVVLNHFFSTVINAAYGIGNQINGVLGYFSSTIQKSVNPQLMESQGTHDREKLLSMTYGLTKFSTLCMAVVALPLLVEMPYVLELWLKNVPEYTVSVSRLIIILSIIYQMSAGLMSAIQSTGRIKWYTTTIGLLLLSTIPVAYAVIAGGAHAEAALVCACFVEAIALGVRLAFAHHLVQISIIDYLRRLVIPMVLLILCVGALLVMTTLVFESSFVRLVAVCMIDVIVFCALVYIFLLDGSERNKIKGIVTKLVRR